LESGYKLEEKATQDRNAQSEPRMWKGGVQDRPMGIASSENGNYSRKLGRKQNVCPLAFFSYPFCTTSHFHDIPLFTPKTRSMFLQKVGKNLHGLVMQKITT
jgi:hypothetical protein